MERLGDGVRRELDRLGPAGAISEIAAAWPGAVGEDVARNAWPARVGRDGTLVVHTSSSAWAFELAQLEAVVREQLGATLGGSPPAALRFVPGPVPEPAAEAAPEAGRTPPPPSAEALAEAGRLTSGIEPEELRRAVAAAAALSLQRARDDRSV